MHYISSIINNIYFLISIFVISFIVLIASYNIPDDFGYPTIKSKAYSGINYNNHSDDKKLSAIKEFTETVASDYKEIDISFNAKVQSISGWNNIFQTAPLNSGIRIELAEPSILALIVKSKKDLFRALYVTQTLQLNRWYYIHIKLDIKKHLTILLDKEIVVDIVDPNFDYDISDIAVGSGFSKTRPFDGELSKFKISYAFYKEQAAGQLSYLLAILKVISIVCILIIPYRILLIYSPE